MCQKSVEQLLNLCNDITEKLIVYGFVAHLNSTHIFVRIIKNKFLSPHVFHKLVETKTNKNIYILFHFPRYIYIYISPARDHKDLSF